MGITIKVGKTEDPGPVSEVKLSLNLRRNLAGDIMIFDHNDIDIVLMPRKSKVMTFPKDSLGDHVYEAQNRLFHFLARKGIVERESIRGGNVFSSMEALVQESQDLNSMQHALLVIGKFIEEEAPLIEFEQAFEAEQERYLSEPLPDESTDFDAKRHSTSKGSIRPLHKYGLSSIYRI